jgi:phenylacetate-coenzyme A ligase PaaK-like adenylate-forming protein
MIFLYPKLPEVRMAYDKISELCARVPAFSRPEETAELFLDAMRENYTRQWEIHPFVRELGARCNVSPERLQRADDVFSIPPLFVGVMKLHSFLSVPSEDVVLTLTSSGTAGQKTHICFDQSSLARLQQLANSSFAAMGFCSQTPAHVLLMSYDPRRANDVGTTWSDEQIMGLSPVLSHHWTIEWDEATQEYRFDSEKWARELVRLAGDAPVRLLGFPAFMFELVETVRRLGLRVRVHPESYIVAGGGWKNHRGVPMSLHEFCSFMEEHVGFVRANIRDTFGMAEHGVPYCSCPHGNFHAPVMARVAAVDPLSLKRMPHGTDGLLQLLTPYNTAQPNLSVLSTDVVTLGENCSCGVPGVYIRSIRRGGKKHQRGCAIAAQEILGKSQR